LIFHIDKNAKKLKVEMKSLIWVYLLVFVVLKCLPSNAFAESSYVLPYPSAMPGSIFYRLNLIREEILRYWYFGDFGGFHFNLKQSDKYLVEAKTLFDYKQYLLAHKALQKSDKYFGKIYPNLLSAKNNGKNISEKKKVLKRAAQKHIEELVKIKDDAPATFNWTPEKEKPTTLNIWESIDKSIKLRQKRL